MGVKQRFSIVATGLLAVASVARADTRAEPPAHDFIDEARALLVVGACADGTPPSQVDPELVAAHCQKVHEAQEDYRKNWLEVADEFFRAHVPAGIPKVVVYPFAGGDLSTALTVFPDADEITTLALEPAGDPRALGRLSNEQLKTALATVATELGSLYRSTFSVTMNMIDAMRSGQLPTQLIFGLSALSMHGYEPISLRYFRLTPRGELRYLTDGDVKRIDSIKDIGWRNREYANIELKFRKKGTTHEQVYRHIMANLNDEHLKSEPAALAHLEKKGNVAAMTKAASYLLTFDEFKTMRKYIIKHVDWMVSDSTGLPPTYGTPAGFEYETWGTFETSNMEAGRWVQSIWRALFAEQPKRELKFRFGYPDGQKREHLIIMKKKS